MTAATFILTDAADVADLDARFRSHPAFRMELPAGVQLAHGQLDGVQEALVISFPPTTDDPHGVRLVIDPAGEHMDLSPEDEPEE